MGKIANGLNHVKNNGKVIAESENIHIFAISF